MLCVVHGFIHGMKVAEQRRNRFAVKNIIGALFKRLFTAGHGDGNMMNVAASIPGINS
jgi:hypothetical protein